MVDTLKSPEGEQSADNSIRGEPSGSLKGLPAFWAGNGLHWLTANPKIASGKYTRP